MNFGDNMIELTSIRHTYPEPNGLNIDRPFGMKEYTFLHFFQSVDIFYEGKIITAKPNAVIIFDIDTPQHFKTSEPLIHNWMHFKGDVKPLLDKYGLKLDTLYYPEDTDFITELVYQCEFEFYGNYLNSKELYNVKFEELLIKLSRSVTGEPISHTDNGIRQEFQSLRSKMLSDLSKHWTIPQMAQEVGFSESRFYRIYKSIYGITPMNDMINIRIEKSKTMLLLQKKSVTEIAEALGYENTTHFIRQFKAKNGISPKEYKNRQDRNGKR